MRAGYVYILASGKNGTLYVGVTADIIARVRSHKDGVDEGFTRRYGVKRLVYYEHTEDIRVAIARESQLKNWKRDWKIALIEKENPSWQDLYDTLF